MSDAIKFFNGMIEEKLSNLHTCIIGRIERFDSVQMVADVQPLFKQRYKGGIVQSMPLLVNVPVSYLKAGAFFIRPPYKKGDNVLVVFAERSLDQLMGGSGDRRHSLDDGVVVGGLSFLAGSLPEEHAEDLLIAHENMKTKIVIDKDGKVMIETETEDINLSTKEGNVNISSIEGNVNIRGKNSSGSW